MTFHSPLKPARPPKGSSCYVCAPEGIDILVCVGSLVGLDYKVTWPEGNGDERIRYGVQRVLESDFLVLIPGYEFNRGANIEVAVARALKLPLLDCASLDIVWQP